MTPEVFLARQHVDGSYRARDRDVVSYSMRRVRSADTGPELALRKALWQRGLRYRLHAKKLPGAPDIVFSRQRLAVFVDGDFWHGRQWQSRGLPRLESQFAEPKAEYWVPKIKRNIERDDRVNRELTATGWTVLRIWESEIRKDLAGCVERVMDALRPAGSA